MKIFINSNNMKLTKVNTTVKSTETICDDSNHKKNANKIKLIKSVLQN